MVTLPKIFKSLNLQVLLDMMRVAFHKLYKARPPPFAFQVVTIAPGDMERYDAFGDSMLCKQRDRVLMVSVIEEFHVECCSRMLVLKCLLLCLTYMYFILSLHVMYACVVHDIHT